MTASLRSRLLRVLVRASRWLERPRGVEEQRRRLERHMQRFKLPSGARVQPVSANGVPGELITWPDLNAGRTLYYLHGGGFHMGSCATHRAFVARMARAAGAQALHISYRLAPEHPFPAAVEDCAAAYRWLLDNGVQARDLVVAGESVGGGLVLTTLLDARDRDVPLARAGVLISPVTDGTLAGKSYFTRAGRDLFVSRAYAEWVVGIYAGDNDLRAPRVSPLFADYRGLPPLLIMVGDDEVLLDDSTRLASRARQAGVDVTLRIWPHMWHGFPLTPFIPEARQAIADIATFLWAAPPPSQAS